MDRADLAPLIDHTVLGPTTTQTAVDRVVDDAIEAGMNVCIPPCYIGSVTDDAPDSLTIATVIGFPHGQAAPATKREAAKTAVAAGADELDVVCNVGRLTAEEQAAVVDELAAITTAVAVPVKVIIETALLTDEEKHRACEAAVDADADMVKTSTGFADAEQSGATVADVELMADYLPVKASGGIGDYETAMAMIEAGADRIGASSGLAILDGAPS